MYLWVPMVAWGVVGLVRALIDWRARVSYERTRAASVVDVLRAASALPSARSPASAATHPQQRRLAVTTLSWFKVVLTATREPGPEPGENVNATITAAGYRHTARGWKLIATKRIGRARGWAWYATDVCSLTVTQLKPGPPSGSPAAVQWDSITVSLLRGPAIGCLRPYTERWRP